MYREVPGEGEEYQYSYLYPVEDITDRKALFFKELQEKKQRQNQVVLILRISIILPKNYGHLTDILLLYIHGF